MDSSETLTLTPLVERNKRNHHNEDRYDVNYAKKAEKKRLMRLRERCEDEENIRDFLDR